MVLIAFMFQRPTLVNRSRVSISYDELCHSLSKHHFTWSLAVPIPIFLNEGYSVTTFRLFRMRAVVLIEWNRISLRNIEYAVSVFPLRLCFWKCAPLSRRLFRHHFSKAVSFIFLSSDLSTCTLWHASTRRRQNRRRYYNTIVVLYSAISRNLISLGLPSYIRYCFSLAGKRGHLASHFPSPRLYWSLIRV